MIKPLSTFKYIESNIKKVVLIVFVMSINVFGILIINSLISQFKKDIFTNFNIYNDYTLVGVFWNYGSTVDSSEKRQSIFDEIVSRIKDKYWYVEVYNSKTNVKTMVGSYGVDIFWMNNDRINDFMNRNNLFLISGRIPENANEIIFTENVANNKNLKVGDKFGESIDSKEWLIGEYTVVGILNGRSDIRLGLSVDTGFMKEKQYPYLLINSSNVTEIDDLKDIYSDSFKLRDQKWLNSDIIKDFDYANIFLYMINGIVLFSMSILVTILSIVFFANRMSEFAILYSIGYSKRYIIKKILIESSISLLIGWLVGILSSCLTIFIINKVFFLKQGLYFVKIEQLPLLISILFPLFISIIISLWVLVKISKVDIIEIIEKR